MKRVSLSPSTPPTYPVSMLRPFLQAHWSNVAIVSYAVPPELLSPYLPKGCQLDTLRGVSYVSLVAFEFDEVKVKGWSIPFHTSFPEVNLRFYVRHGDERGVVFIREFVPKRLVAMVASAFYNEPYSCVKMSVDTHRLPDGTQVKHVVHVAGHRQMITVATTSQAPLLPTPESDDAWFKEHEWGFGKDHRGRTLRYRVAHHQWLTYHISWHEVKMDWKRVYGEKWGFLRNAKPASVILAEGSPVTVFAGSVV